MRDIAIGTARHRLTRMGIDPLSADPDAALNNLDDLLREDPGKIAAIWYERASDGVYQLQLFRRDWRRWQREAKRREEFREWYARNCGGDYHA
jgi:hypothetical protein